MSQPGIKNMALFLHIREEATVSCRHHSGHFFPLVFLQRYPLERFQPLFMVLIVRASEVRRGEPEAYPLRTGRDLKGIPKLRNGVLVISMRRQRLGALYKRRGPIVRREFLQGDDKFRASAL